MSNKGYDIFKMIVLIIYPAVVACIGTILQTLNVECTGVVVTILTAIEVMLGTIIEKLSAAYKKKTQVGIKEGE